MLKDTYFTLFNKDFTSYEFDSIRVKGIIRKRVEYSPLAFESYYNLGFGDVNKITNEIDDLIVTNNGDSEKVLLTVAQTLRIFFEYHPEAYVFATGSTPARTRLYKIGISNNIAK